MSNCAQTVCLGPGARFDADPIGWKGLHPASRRAFRRIAAFWLAALWVFSGLFAPVQAQSVRLSDIFRMALESDAQFAAARAAATAGQEKSPQARASQLPSVNFSYAPRYNRERSSVFDGPLDYSSGNAALTLNQPLYRPANALGVQQAAFQVQQIDQQLELARQDLLLRVSTAYFDILQTQDQLSAARGQLAAMSEQLAQSKRAFEVGTVPVTDVNESQARHDYAVAQEIAASNEFAAKRRVLEKIIARPLPRLALLDPAASVDLIDPQEQERLVQAAAQGSLQSAINRSAVEAARVEVSRRNTGHMPTVDFVATARTDRNVNYGRFGASDSRVLSGGVELAVPIYQGGYISSRVREALADLDRAEKELLNAERQSLLDAQQAQLGVQSGSSLTRALAQAQSSAQSQLRSVQRGLQVGVRTRVDVLNAEHQLYVTRRDLATARYRTLISSLQLRAAAGTLTDKDLGSLDALLID